MNASQSTILAVTNQKGGVGKTTTAVHLTSALATNGYRTLLVDMDPQGNASQALGFKLQDHRISVADLIWDKTIPTEQAICKRAGLDVIVANPSLARVERGMVTLTNSELRLAQRLRGLRTIYDFIVIDSAPSFGPLLNSVLNAAEHLIVPVDSNFFALMGIQKLLGEIDEIRSGTNSTLNVLGYLMTMVDRTIICGQTNDAVTQNFSSLVFSTRIRRAVSLREAPMLGKTVFEYEPHSGAAEEYLRLAVEVSARLQALKQNQNLRLIMTSSERSASWKKHFLERAF